MLHEYIRVDLSCIDRGPVVTGEKVRKILPSAFKSEHNMTATPRAEGDRCMKGAREVVLRSQLR